MSVELRQWDFEDYRSVVLSLAATQTTRLSSAISVALMPALVSVKRTKRRRGLSEKIIDIVKRPPNKLNLLHSRLICRMLESSPLEINLCVDLNIAAETARK